ncbi:MAG: hypothetical protein NXH71_05330 [Erythrobacteraceae bacterium]|nr:hypothetical protein [Erythrobacteraceae bacterium]
MDKTTQKGNAGSAAPLGAAKPQGVLVLGMHRSGTSACTRVLNLLGCALSDNLLGAAEGNESGHWEPLEVVALNDKILESAGSSHDDWGPLNADWRQSAIRAQMVSRASQIITDHTKIGPLFAIKDPRICRLADVWLEAATDAGVDPLVLLMLRNPVEVASSLEARDLMADGYGELLWLRHVLDAEFYSRDQKRIVCRYDELMSNWQALVEKITRGLGVSFPRNSPKVHAEISQFLTQAQRNHTVDNAAVAENPSYSHWLRTTFKIMLKWSEHGENVADHAVLDEIRAELDRSYDMFARLLLKPELTGLAGSGGQLRDELSIVQAEIERLGTELGEKTASQEREAELRAQREAELTARIDEETANTEALQAEIERLGAELAVKTSQLADVQSAARASQANAEAELERRERAEAQLRETSHEVQDEKLRNAELAGQISTLQSTLVQRQEELAQFLNEFKVSERTRGAAEAELERERQRRMELDRANNSYERKLDALTGDLVKMTTLLQQQEDDSKILSGELSDRAAEAHHLAERVRELASAADTAEAARAVNEQKLAARFGELAQLTTIAAQETERANALQSNAEWLNNVRRLEEGFPTWWAIMPQAWQMRRKHRRYRGASLFDSEEYLAQYPDVAEQGMDPLRHYILHGMAEGRMRT